METADARRPDAGVADFLNFLRGMETGRDGEVSPPCIPFLNFLRGMETLRDGALRGLYALLPKLP